MISQKLQDAINAQIVAEMWSANLYLSMSYFFAAKGYEGFAAWMKAQSREENDLLKRENEELRLQLNNLKLKAVSTQQSEFNTATQHQ